MSISVVVPVRDDPKGLVLALEGLAQQSRPPDEVTVVDAGGGYETDRVVDRFRNALPLDTLHIGAAYPGSARNAGLQAARHPWVAFVDAGTRPTREWLNALAAAAEREPRADVICGCYVPRIKDEWDWAACASYVAPGSPPTGGRGPTTASLMLTQEAWNALGGQKEHLRAGEDLLFFDEIARRGMRTAQADEARVEWELPQSLKGHFHRLRRYSASVLQSHLWKRWHRAVFLMHTTTLGLLIAGFVVHWTALVALPVLAACRILKNYSTRSPWLPGNGLSASRLSRLVIMTLLVDLATFAGTYDHIFSMTDSEASQCSRVSS
jgi:glycosyltransferase involved in cell wall biosynthesis